MNKSYRKTIRFNPEYDHDIIEKMKQYTDRNLSKLLRQFIRDGFKLLSDKTKKDKSKTQTIKWNFPD